MILSLHLTPNAKQKRTQSICLQWILINQGRFDLIYGLSSTHTHMCNKRLINPKHNITSLPDDQLFRYVPTLPYTMIRPCTKHHRHPSSIQSSLPSFSFASSASVGPPSALASVSMTTSCSSF